MIKKLTVVIGFALNLEIHNNTQRVLLTDEIKSNRT